MNIYQIYGHPKQAIADVTYGEGGWWRYIDHAGVMGSDLHKGDLRYDYTALPYGDSCFDVVCFDPPNKTDNVAKGLAECFRVCKPGGMVWAGGADQDPPRAHVQMFSQGIGNGGTPLDLFVLSWDIPKQVQQRRGASQAKADRNHRYYWVFKCQQRN